MIPEARPSASVCLLRQAPDGGCEVLLAQRGRGARFMGGAWVFPGGVIDALDASAEARAALDDGDADDAPHRAAALRELVEEAGIWLAAEPFSVPVDGRPHGSEVYALAAASPERRLAGQTLSYFSNWITPTAVPVRFDARFYVAVVDAGLEGVPDHHEMDDVAWIDPDAALAPGSGLILPLPTRRTLRHFAELGNPQAIVAHAEQQETVLPIQPRLSRDPDGSVIAVLPGEPGYDDLADAPPDPETLQLAARVTTLQGEPIPELERRED